MDRVMQVEATQTLKGRAKPKKTLQGELEETQIHESL
jgi:hypothetical protein